MLHNPSINLPIFLTYPLPNIFTIIYSKLHGKYHIKHLVFSSPKLTKRESQGNYNSNDPCNFLPQNEKGRKTEHLLRCCQSQFFFGLPASPSRPTTGPRVMRGGLMRVSGLKR